MSTVRFRLDDEQLPFPTAAQSHQFPGSEKESKFAGYSPIGRISPSYEQTGSQGLDQTFGSLGSGGRSFFQSNGTPSSHTFKTVHQYSSSSSPTIAVQKMDSPFLYDTSCRVHETANHKPLQQELFNGGMERPAFDSVNGQRPNSPKHDVLASLKARNPLLADSVDTDICLSMVNETRPSYQIKTAGKQPLSPPHLTSLIENGGARPFSKFSTSSDRREPFHAYYSPSSPNNYSTFASTSLSPASCTNKSFSPSSSSSHPVRFSPTPPPPPPPPLQLYQKSFSPTNSSKNGAYGQSNRETSAYKLCQKLARETPPLSATPPPAPAPPPPPPPPLPQNTFYSRTTCTIKERSISPVQYSPKISPDRPVSLYRKEMNHSFSSSANKPTRTFNDYDPDDILRDLRNLQSTRTTSTYRTTTNGQNRPAPISPGQHSVVSPKARGLAPAPTDQPVRCPATRGIEANVDALTIRMMRNMDTGYGAAGSTNCAKCGEGIFSNRPGCVALNKTFHIDCFTCSVCNCKLSGSPFYAVDDKEYCEKDYIDTLDKCDTCQRPIRDRILRASGKAYHPQCFVCASCCRELDGIPFTVDANNVNYCMQCFHDKFAPRCAACHKPIAPVEGEKETTRVVAMDRSYHVDCYACEDCGLKLSSAIEGHGCYPLDNHLLCKNCNMARIRKLTATST